MRRSLLAVALLCSTALPTLAEKRVALVLAADDYELIRPLENAVNDAQAIEESLEKLGFEVSLETDRNLKRMRRALEDFREDAAGADVALVYFAGHGVEIAGENRLLPTDADASSVEALKQTSLPLEEVRATLAEVSKVNLILLDACRNDPFGGGDGSGRGAKALSVKETPDVKPGFGRLGTADNLLYTFSAAPGATAADGSGDNSPFTSALAKYLPTDGLEIRSVLTLVQQEVYDLSRGEQLPYVENGLPQVFFASTAKSDLPERERLLLAMADVTPDLRDQVERLAREKDMPLAPLYGALISSDASALTSEQRAKKLVDAADAFVATRTQMRTLASADPVVAGLRQEAERQLALGAFETARGKLAEAATIDAVSRDALKANFLDRTFSEASTHLISGGASRAALKYDLAIESYRKATALLDEVDGQQLPDDERRNQLQAFEVLGDIYVTVGDLAEGRKAYERQQAVATRLADADPSSTAWRGALASSLLKLGNVQRDQGDSTAALGSYESALDLRKALVAAEPQNAVALGLEAAAHLQVGALHKLQGNADKALSSYLTSRDILQRLATADPADEAARQTLASSLRLIGEIQLQQQKWREALASFASSLDIAKTLAQAKPGDPARQFDLAVAYDGIGTAQYRPSGSFGVEDAKAAIGSYDASIAIVRTLMAADPKNTALPRALAGTLEKLAETIRFGTQKFEHDGKDLELVLNEAVGMREALVTSDPANKVWVADLAFSYEKMATWYAFIPDEMAAIDFSKKAHKATLDLAALDRENVDWQRKASLYHAKISESYIQLKDYKSALDYELKGLDYAIGVAKANPSKPIYYNDVTTIQDRIARIYWIQKDFNNYWAQNDTRLEQAQRNEKRFPNDLDALRHLYQAYISVGESWTKNEPKKALELFGNARTYAERAASLDTGNPEFLYGIYDAQRKSAYVIEEGGDRAASEAAYKAALATIEKAVALAPDNVTYTASREHVLARLDMLHGRRPGAPANP